MDIAGYEDDDIYNAVHFEHEEYEIPYVIDHTLCQAPTTRLTSPSSYASASEYAGGTRERLPPAPTPTVPCLQTTRDAEISRGLAE